MIAELNFNDAVQNEQDLLSSLTWSSISHNIEVHGMTLDAAKRLWPSNAELIDAVYQGEIAKRGMGDEV